MRASSNISPAARRREKMRMSILEAAEQVFAEEGEKGLSIRRLAEAIDYSPAAIYKYFGSKDELLDELKEAFFSQVIEDSAKLDAIDCSFQERSRYRLRAYIDGALSKPHHYAAAFSGQVENKIETYEGILDQKKGQAFKIVLDMVVKGQTLGVYRDGVDPGAMARSIWASCHGLAALMIHLPKFLTFDNNARQTDRDEFIDFHVEQILRGLEIPRSDDESDTKKYSVRMK